MPRAKCEIRGTCFITTLGWAGAAVSDKGVVMVVLPKASRKAVERELVNAECRLPNEREETGRSKGKAEHLLSRAVLLLQMYFSGSKVRFDLPLDIGYHTGFQQAAWRACMKIPYGETRSYAWLARKLKKPGAARAAGQAMGANPIPVVVP